MVFNWPEGKKMAVCLTWDFDGESAAYLRYKDQSKKLLSELHQRRYGPTIAMPKILRLLEKYELQGTFYVPGYTAGVYPEVIKEINQAGHKLGLHGYLHEALDNLSVQEEEEVLLRSMDVFDRLLANVPRIYRSPSWELTRATPNLLIKHGVLSDSSLMDDEVPYALQGEKDSLVEIPIQWILDDAEYWGHTKATRNKVIVDPDTVFKIWQREFDGYYESGGAFVLTLHPFISGRSVYMQTLERLIQYMRQFPNVWWTNMDELTNYAHQLKQANQLEVKTSPPPEPYPFEALFNK